MMIFLAILTGVNIVVARFLNAGSAQRSTLSMSTLLNYVTGLVTSLVALWLSGEVLGLAAGESAPFYPLMYLGGAFGVAAVLLSNYLTPRLPAFLLTLLIFVAQLLTGLVLDYVLLGDFSLGKLLGGVFVLLGLWHYQSVHRRVEAKVAAE